VDVGSVGYPRHNFFSSYALFDSRTMDLELRRIEFDFPGYVAKFGEKGIALPHWLERLGRTRRFNSGGKLPRGGGLV
jgi:hypothetical protein